MRRRVRAAIRATAARAALTALASPLAWAGSAPPPANPATATVPALPATAAAATIATAASAVSARLATRACRLPGVAAEARCGELHRPLDPARPEGLRLTLRFAVLPATARRPAAEPVFFFAGGPGQSAVALAGAALRLLARVNVRRDVVLLEQRGTGGPSGLHCAAPADAAWRPLGRMLDRAASLDDLRDCLARLQRLPHGDLRHYTTAHAADDAEALRVALGATRVDAVGVSYGTRVVLEWLRRQPDALRRVVLDGVAPPGAALRDAGEQAQSALDALLAACSAAPACAARHPGLRARWAAWVAAPPRAVTLMHPLSGMAESLTLDGAAWHALLRPVLAVPALAAALPAAMEAAMAGRPEALSGLSAAASGAGAGAEAAIAEGAHFAALCAEDAAGALRPDAGGFDAPLAALYGAACAAFAPGRLPPGFGRMAPVRQPVLLLAGGADPATPAQQARAVAAALGPSARLLVVPQAGHGLLGSVPCAADAAFAFLDAGDDAAAATGAATCPALPPQPPAFVAPGRP